MNDTTMVETALALIWEGVQVVPLHTPTRSVRGGCSCMRRGCGRSAGKHPRVANGHLGASDDIEQVITWWRRWPLANIGCRPRPWELVVDIDVRNGGDTALARWEQRNGTLPRTRTAATGGGGEHRWFKIPEGLDLVAQLAEGVDLKSHSGLVVMPPSLHLSGRRYRWTDESPIADAPARLLAAITRRPRPTTSRTADRTGDPGRRMAALCRVIEDAGPGAHNRALFWSACQAARAGLDPEPLRAAALRVGRDTPQQVDRTLASALRAVAHEQERSR